MTGEYHNTGGNGCRTLWLEGVVGDVNGEKGSDNGGSEVTGKYSSWVQ